MITTHTATLLMIAPESWRASVVFGGADKIGSDQNSHICNKLAGDFDIQKVFFWDEKYRFVFSRKNCKKIGNLLIPCPPQFYSPVMPSGLSIRGSQYKCHSTLSVMSSLGRDTIYHQTIGTTKHISNSFHLQSPHVCMFI